MSGPTPFVGVQAGFDPLFPRNQLQAYWKSQYLDALPDEAVDAIAARANDRPAPLTLVNTFHMGGAIGDVGPEDTAFHERSSPYMVSIDGMWSDPADTEANVGWVRSAWDDVEPVRYRRRLPQLHRAGGRGTGRGRGQRLRPQPPPSRRGEGQL